MKVTHKATFVVAALMGLNSLALAHGETMHLYMDGNTPKIGLRDEMSRVTEQRAFKGTLAWNNGRQAFTTASPAFSWSEEWTAEDELGFNVLTAVQKWDGSQFVNTDQQFTISYGSDSLVTNGGFQEGFWMLIGGDDHKHVRYTLNGVAQNDPNTAVYRINMEGLRHEAHDHEPIVYPGFGLVLNRGADQATFDSAYQWALANPVPEPATLVALGAGLAALARRRRA